MHLSLSKECLWKDFCTSLKKSVFSEALQTTHFQTAFKLIGWKIVFMFTRSEEEWMKKIEEFYQPIYMRINLKIILKTQPHIQRWYHLWHTNRAGSHTPSNELTGVTFSTKHELLHKTSFTLWRYSFLLSLGDLYFWKSFNLSSRYVSFPEISRVIL